MNHTTTCMNFPMITLDEEQMLARDFKLNNNLDAAHRLVTSHLKLVVSIARDYAGYNLPQEDLVQEGSVGLMKAVKSFDPDRNVRLSHHAIPWIRFHITEYIIRNWRMVKIATTKAQRKLFFNLRKLRQTLSPLNEQETNRIATTLNVSKDDVKEMEMRMNGTDVALEYERDDDDSYHILDSIPDYESEPCAMLGDIEFDAAKTKALNEAISLLDERSKQVLEARVLTEDETTLHDLSKKLGISKERVRQIENRAVQKISEYVKSKLDC